jgi:hypothetical protein
MIMVKGQIYCCQNPRCRAEIQVVRDSIEGESVPTCCCGAKMKKPYSRPVFKRLEATPELVALFEDKAIRDVR